MRGGVAAPDGQAPAGVDGRVDGVALRERRAFERPYVDGPAAGGPLRYVVTALPAGAPAGNLMPRKLSSG